MNFPDRARRLDAGSRTSREASVSVHCDGVISRISASPKGNTRSGHDRRGRSVASCRHTVIPSAIPSLAKRINARSSADVTRR